VRSVQNAAHLDFAQHGQDVRRGDGRNRFFAQECEHITLKPADDAGAVALRARGNVALCPLHRDGLE